MLPQPAADLLPQKDPFRLVDTMDEAGEDMFSSAFTVPVQHVLCTDGFLSEGGLLENMAQTAAAGTGYWASLQGTPPPVGFIGAIKRINIRRKARAGEQLQTTVRITNRVGQAIIAQASLQCGDETLASCELTIFLQS